MRKVGNLLLLVAGLNFCMFFWILTRPKFQAALPVSDVYLASIIFSDLAGYIAAFMGIGMVVKEFLLDDLRVKVIVNASFLLVILGLDAGRLILGM